MAKTTESQNKDELLTPEELAAHAMMAAEAEKMDDLADVGEAGADAEEETEHGEVADDEAHESETQEEAAVEDARSAIQQLKDFVNEDEEHAFKLNFNFKALVGGDGLSRVLAKNWFFILVVVFFTCCYVTTRYMMQGAMLEHEALTDTLIDRRYKALTLSSELLEHTLSSQIESSLQDSTIHVPSDQAFSLKAE